MRDIAAATLAPSRRVAVIGAGVAGAACAATLMSAGLDVTVFDKSRGVGGRMATRRVPWSDANDAVRLVDFDHGCPYFTATSERFTTVVRRAERVGAAAHWQPHVYAGFPTPRVRQVVVPVPDMPAFSRHLLEGVPLRLGQAVTALERRLDGWHLHLAGHGVDPVRDGPYQQVVIAMPPAQAATLLAGHQDVWAASLREVPMQPCWTLMAVTNDVDWPWDAAEPERSALAWVGRTDRKPGRPEASDSPASPEGPDTSMPRTARWVAHATPAWSLAHLESDPAQVTELLRAALGRLMPGRAAVQWLHTSVHRWRYARRSHVSHDDMGSWLNVGLGLGVCGDAFGNGSVEAAWCSGDDLAQALVESLVAQAAAVTRSRVVLEPTVRARHAGSFFSASERSTGHAL